MLKPLRMNDYIRNGEWLEFSASMLKDQAAAAGQEIQPLQANSHPHHVRQWLLALAFFPDKWLNRLFSVGGIQMEGDLVKLRTFIPVDPSKDPVYRLARLPRQKKMQMRLCYLRMIGAWCWISRQACRSIRQHQDSVERLMRQQQGDASQAGIICPLSIFIGWMMIQLDLCCMQRTNWRS